MPSRFSSGRALPVVLGLAIIASFFGPLRPVADGIAQVAASESASQPHREAASSQLGLQLEPAAASAITAPAGPVVLREHPAVDCAQAKCVALTFDDGPGPYTERLLDMLASRGDVATFFMLGQNASRYPATLVRMMAEGHQLANHTYDHAQLTALDAQQVADEVDSTSKIIEQLTGMKPQALRPPYGAHNALVDKASGMPLVLWDVDTLDWQHHDPDKTLKIAMKQVHPGSIILMHDIHETSVQAVPRLLAKLEKKGYALVTVDQLFAGQELKAGTAYARRN